MPDRSFESLQNQLQMLYQNNQNAAALDLVEQNVSRYPEQRHLLSYWQAVLYARLEQPEKAVDVLGRMLESGFWYGEVLLRKSPSFQPLQSVPEFQALIEKNRQLRAQEQEQVFPVLTLRSQGRCTAGSEPCPVLLALHANASSAQETVPFWQAAAHLGWLVALPQSSQAMWKDAYIWDDRETAGREVLNDYGSILAQYAIDTDELIVAGHSMGGEIAIWLALTRKIPARGFFVIGPAGPWMDDLDEWEPWIEASTGIGMRGYIVIGEEDTSIPHENIHRFVEKLNRAGIPCQLEMIPDAGHDFVPDYEDCLIRALDFITE